MTNTNFDLGLFQEVYMIPQRIRKNYHLLRGEMNTILLKKEVFKEKIMKNVLPINARNDEVCDFYISCETKIDGKTLSIFSIYNYMGGKLDNFSELLNELYEYLEKSKNKIIIIGGDFNMDKKFPYYKNWGKLAKEIKEKMLKLGYIYVVEKKCGKNAFTYITPSKKAKYQLDYLFLPKNVKVLDIKVGKESEIFKTKPRLSDHLPIFATIEV